MENGTTVGLVTTPVIAGKLNWKLGFEKTPRTSFIADFCSSVSIEKKGRRALGWAALSLRAELVSCLISSLRAAGGENSSCFDAAIVLHISLGAFSVTQGAETDVWLLSKDAVVYEFVADEWPSNHSFSLRLQSKIRMKNVSNLFLHCFNFANKVWTLFFS